MMLQKLQIKSIFPGFHAFSCLNLCITYSVVVTGRDFLNSQPNSGVYAHQHMNNVVTIKTYCRHTIMVPTNAHKYNEFNLYTQ